MFTKLRTGFIGAIVIFSGALMCAPAYAAPSYQDSVATGTIGGTPKSGSFTYGTTFSAISNVTASFSGDTLGRNEGVVLVLGTQTFHLGTEASIGVTASPPFTRNIALDHEALVDLADGSINRSEESRLGKE